MRPALRWAPIMAGLVLACRGEPRGPVDEARVQAMVDSLRPEVERAAGLRFREAVRVRMTSREEVRDYLLGKVDKDFPPERLDGVQAAYRLLGLFPDSLVLRDLLLDLYTEQVAGYYDPELRTLYAVRGADPTQVRLILAHELVHALQHHYLPLDSLMAIGDDADRLAAIQAVLEGHATVVSIRTLTPGRDPTAEPDFWETYREQVRAQQEGMEIFRNAPRALREGLVFPYLDGARFMAEWGAVRASGLPVLDSLPLSTEQILHPERYPGDRPVSLRFTHPPAPRFDDTLGELETAILLAELRGTPTVDLRTPLGWGGDRLLVDSTSAGHALAWLSVWDSGADADRVATALQRRSRARAGYRLEIDRLEIDGRPGLRFIHAPEAWSGWGDLPTARVSSAP